ATPAAASRFLATEKKFLRPLIGVSMTPLFIHLKWPPWSGPLACHVAIRGDISSAGAAKECRHECRHGRPEAHSTVAITDSEYTSNNESTTIRLHRRIRRRYRFQLVR